MSGPEQPIHESFSHPDRHGTYVPLVLDDDYQPDNDIKLFLRECFDDIWQTHVLKSHISVKWPSDDEIDALVEKSSGQFIYASTVIQYTQSPRHRPMNQLNDVLRIGSCKDATLFAELDALYMHILQSADEAQRDVILRIFGFLLFRRSTEWPWRIKEISEMEDFLNLQPGDMFLVLADFHSVLHIPSSSKKTHYTNLAVYFLHASMSDFLLNTARSQNFFVDEGKAQAELAQSCMMGIYSSSSSITIF